MLQQDWRDLHFLKIRDRITIPLLTANDPVPNSHTECVLLFLELVVLAWVLHKSQPGAELCVHVIYLLS